MSDIIFFSTVFLPIIVDCLVNRTVTPVGYSILSFIDLSEDIRHTNLCLIEFVLVLRTSSTHVLPMAERSDQCIANSACSD